VVEMRNGLVIIAIILLFISYEILLSLSRFLSPGRAFEITERLYKRAVHQIFNLMGTYCGVRLEFVNGSGRELPKRFLLVANHQSLMDIPVCIALFHEHKVRFVAKRELGSGIPFVSLILRSQGHALIKRRGDAPQAMRSILHFARRCEREGTCPVIFPEGTRSLDGTVGVFHTAGVRKVLAENPLPLVAAVIDGGWRIAKVKDLFRNLKGARYRVRILSISPSISKKKDVLEALERAREEIAIGLARMRAEE
jgi:1-acyl-sn-glycerol-3-phosphate acyltransferase